ncbi:MAG: flippase-like domain-containing protein [Proteobacteria bacterium]|nr:flippase-like domain-containing protein [Pseudomonadota bacterium]
MRFPVNLTRQKRNLLLKVLVSAAILFALSLRIDTDNLSEAFSVLRGSEYLLAAALLLMICQSLILAGRWMLFINMPDRKLNYASALRIILASQIANLLLITSLGGIVMRIALTTRYGISMLRAACMTAADRFMTLMALLLLGTVALPALDYYMDNRLYTAVSTTILSLLALSFILTPLALGFFLKKSAPPDRKLDSFISYMRSFLFRPDLCAKIVITSLAAQIVYFASIYAVTLPYMHDMPFFGLMAVLPAIALVSSLPIGFGGWGIREGAFIYGLGLIGIPMEQAFLISVEIGVIGMASTILASLPMFLSSSPETLLLFRKKAPACRTAD